MRVAEVRGAGGRCSPGQSRALSSSLLPLHHCPCSPTQGAREPSKPGDRQFPFIRGEGHLKDIQGPFKTEVTIARFMDALSSHPRIRSLALVPGLGLIFTAGEI